jgi:hypothetical protein
MPSSASTHSIHVVSWRSPSRSLFLGKTSHGANQDTEKSSQPEHRCPRRHQQLSAMTLRQLHEIMCVKMPVHFLRLPDSKARSARLNIKRLA